MFSSNGSENRSDLTSQLFDLGVLVHPVGAPSSDDSCNWRVSQKVSEHQGVCVHLHDTIRGGQHHYGSLRPPN